MMLLMAGPPLQILAVGNGDPSSPEKAAGEEEAGRRWP